MKLKTIVVAAATLLSLGLGITSYAGTSGNRYYPPERIHCMLKDAKLSCEGFSHHLLVEDVYTADFSGKDNVFAFYSGAYYKLNESESTVLYTYRNKHQKTVRLRSASNAVRPDFSTGHWTKVQDDLYVCKGGYMQCPITA